MDKLLEKITASVIDTDEGDAAELAQEAVDAGGSGGCALSNGLEHIIP